ncbi:hypothetical protein [Stenotrophomonas rhizophila]|uniref:hypothetical protein n=1 Tax=Stenotrophomonas rhizophila TaxID=216778 RepID=UPI0028ABEE53|nr:hypothetical protein [Stenotrophomonas rhizophila]
MNRRLRLTPCTAMLVLLSACQPAPVPLSDAAIAVRDAAPEDLFVGRLQNVDVELLVQDCKVFQVTRGPEQAVALTEVLAPPPYPLFTVCDRQSLRVEDGAVVASLGRMAIAAGGCCATGGTWRSTDGQQWLLQ